MRLSHGFITLMILITSCSALADNKRHSRIGIDVGVAYDLDLGITAQHKGYTLFFNGDAVAFDVRVQNFYNDRKSLHLYVDMGGFVESYGGNNNSKDDRAGIRMPVGLTFGLERNLEAYVQAVPNFDFSNDAEFDIDAALGIRYRF